MNSPHKPDKPHKHVVQSSSSVPFKNSKSFKFYQKINFSQKFTPHSFCSILGCPSLCYRIPSESPQKRISMYETLEMHQVMFTPRALYNFHRHHAKDIIIMTILCTRKGLSEASFAPGHSW